MSLAFYRAHPERVRALLIIDTGPGFKKDEARDAWNKRAHETAGASSAKASRCCNPSAANADASHRDAGPGAGGPRHADPARCAGDRSLPDIKVPSLMVVGADDTPFLAASDYMAAKIPGAKKAVIRPPATPSTSTSRRPSSTRCCRSSVACRACGLLRNAAKDWSPS